MCIIQHQLLENKFKAMILKKNSGSYARRRVSFGFATLCIVGILLGIIVFTIGAREGYIHIDGRLISEHFISIFLECDTILEGFSRLLKASSADLRHLFFIFISGFTYFCFLASSAIAFAKGFSIGFSFACLYAIIADIPGLNIASATIFVLAKSLILANLLALAVDAFIFSYDFRTIKINRSVLRRAPCMYKYIFSLIRAVGSSLLINLIYYTGISII